MLNLPKKITKYMYMPNHFVLLIKINHVKENCTSLDKSSGISDIGVSHVSILVSTLLSKAELMPKMECRRQKHAMMEPIVLYLTSMSCL